MRKSEMIGELSKALSAFQKSAPKIEKNKTAKIQTKTGSYEYKYADLSDVLDKVRGLLADNGIAFMQSPTTTQGEQALTTIVSHESGQWIEETMKLAVVGESPQNQGSAITYARRYMLMAMLGLVSDDDTDAQELQTISSIQKKQLWEAAKKVNPEMTDPYSMTRFIAEVVGKHPNRMLASEFDDALQAMEMYTENQFKEIKEK